VIADYVPQRGEIVWLTFTPQAGHEQAGRRPALVLSPRAYNAKTSLMLACPVTSQVKGYPFEVLIPPGARIQGAILADQARSLDWRTRGAEPADALDAQTVAQILEKIQLLLGF